MTYTIDTSQGVSLKLNPTAAEAVTQNVYCLLQTTQGDIPCYREYGVDKSFVSMLTTVGENVALSAIAKAMADFFPELNVGQVEFSLFDTGAPEHISARIEVMDNE